MRLDIETQRHCDRLEISLFLPSELVNLQGCLDLLRGHLLPAAVFAIDTDALAFFRHVAALTIQTHATCLCPQRLIALTGHVHLLGESRVLLHLFLRVPEPFVDLILLQLQVLAQLRDLVATRRLSIHRLVELPQGLFLVFRFASAILKFFCGDCLSLLRLCAGFLACG